jgi:hypothetical protein
MRQVLALSAPRRRSSASPMRWSMPSKLSQSVAATLQGAGARAAERDGRRGAREFEAVAAGLALDLNLQGDAALPLALLERQALDAEAVVAAEAVEQQFAVGADGEARAVDIDAVAAQFEDVGAGAALQGEFGRQFDGGIDAEDGAGEGEAAPADVGRPVVARRGRRRRR